MYSHKLLQYGMYLMVAGALLFLPACRPSAEDRVEANIRQSLGQSRHLMVNATQRKRAARERMYRDAYNGNSVLVWGPIALQADKLTDRLIADVERTRNGLARADLSSLLPRQSQSLLAHLQTYRAAMRNLLTDTTGPPYHHRPDYLRQVAAIDSLMKVWWEVPDNANTDGTNWAVAFATSKRATDITFLLDNLLLDIQLIGDRLRWVIQHASAPILFCGIVQRIPNAVFEGERVALGDTAKFVAGLFEAVTARRVTVQLKQDSLVNDAEGLVTFSLKAATGRGKHSIPVTITYLRPDSTILTWTKAIHYVVAN